MRRKLPYESLDTLSKALLFTCVFLLAFLSFSLVTFWFERRATQQLRAQLLSQAELQTVLLASQASDHSPYPHLDPAIGFVLNPHMKESTWGGPDQGPAYPINSIGLRGAEITAKAADTTRILLVGDSYVFGWRLRDEERISSIMNHYLEERLPSAKIEVLTVALPGWNVLSEKAFLENHLDQLQPDFIVWKPLRNDLEDVAGVVPPGVLASWNSPQKTGQNAFLMGSDYHKDLAMPVIMERWDAILAAIQSMQTEYRIPVLILGLNPHKRPLWEALLSRTGAQTPTVTIPSRFTDDRESWCISERDCHPSPWAARVIALGLLGKLTSLDVIPRIEFIEEEAQVLVAFRREESRRVSAEEARRFFQAQLARVPSEFTAGEPQSQLSVLYGLDAETGMVSRRGLLFLRDPGESSSLDLDLETPANPRAYPRSAVFTVRNQEGAVSRIEIEIATQRTLVHIPLPQGPPESVYELFWEFDYSGCISPVFCTSGTLHAVRFGELSRP